MKVYFSLFLLILFSCNINVDKIQEVNMKVINVNMSKKFVTVELLNTSETSYFITMDTTRLDGYLSFNTALNKATHLEYDIYDGNQLISPKGEMFIFKADQINSKVTKCFEIDTEKAKLYYEGLKELNNVIVLHPNKKKDIQIPFTLNTDLCNGNIKYDLDKNKKYFIQLNYKMNEKIIDSVASKALQQKLSTTTLIPYYKNIISDKYQF
ncbi:hypothetical protein [Flavobacterium sp. '19STA2R22 D10 B1']|uniref:hypothetical protein n=1 Tax=Flavobacterium aerium TaxID=3037261 RepID=UPI00278C372F|nr:hypothetical protein [Flavobacterium sp. '19STA2R22 D10 B1']